MSERPRVGILDTGLLLLYLVGRVDLSLLDTLVARTDPRVPSEFKSAQNVLVSDIVLPREIVARHERAPG